MRSTRITGMLSLIVLGLSSSLLAQDLQSPAQRRMSLPARQPEVGITGNDRADLRRDWNLWWFGGAPTPEYLDYVNQLAGREAEKWSHLMPGAQSEPNRMRSMAPTWVNLGPTGNITDSTWPDHDAGRPSAVVADPRTDRKVLYVATSGGGVFKCANADPSLPAGAWIWTPLTDSLPVQGGSGNLSVGALALDPTNPDTLFLGLGDHVDAEGRGLYKSINGGSTWTVATGLGAATRIGKILPLTSSTILAATNDGLKISSNGGSSFSPVSGSLASGRIWSLAKLGSNLIASQQLSDGSGEIYFSTSNGSTWTKSSISGVSFNIGRITLESSSSSATTAWAILENSDTSMVARGLLTTTNGGANWSWLAAPTVSGGLFQGIGNQMTGDGGQSNYNHLLAVDPKDVNRVFVAANLALYRTEDGGQNWTQLTHWYAHRHVYCHADFHTNGWSSDGNTLYIGNDGGLTILRQPRISSAQVPTATGTVAAVPDFLDHRRNAGIASHLIYNIGSTTAAIPADSRYRITLGLQDNGTRVRTDMSGSGGPAMKDSGIFEDRIGGDGFGTLIHPTNGDLMLGSLYYTRIYRSTNGGRSAFASSNSGISESGSSSNAPFAPKLSQGSEPDTVYTATYPKVYKSTNFGTSWTALGTSGLPSSYSIRSVSASPKTAGAVAVALNSGRFAVSYNDGGNWTSSSDVTGGLLNTGYVWFNTENPQIVYGTSVAKNATGNHLYKSSNGGQSWAPLDTPTNGFPYGIPVHVVKNHPGDVNKLYVGTEFGVYRSTDGGSNWERFGDGLPLVAARDLYIAPDGSFMRVGTYGRGVWEIELGGVTPTAPVIVTQPQSTSANIGATANFSVNATGSTPLSFQWKMNGSSVGTNSPNYTTAPLTLNENGAQIVVRVSNAIGFVESNPAILTVNNQQNLLLNGDMESGSTGWTLYNKDMISEGISAVTPHSLSHFLWLGTWETPTDDWAHQNVSIPSNATTASLSFWMGIGNYTGVPTTPTNIFRLKIQDSSGATTHTTYTKDNTHAAVSGGKVVWNQHGPIDLLPYKGQTVRIRLESTQPGTAGTIFAVDDVALLIQTGSSTGVQISVSPSTASVPTGATASFQANVTGTSNTAVTWSLTGGGSLSNTTANPVIYTAPSTPGTVTLTATSQADSSKKASATITITGAKTKDLNGDGVIDVRDMAYVARAYGKNSMDANWSLFSPADLNSDNVVNDDDITLMLAF